MSLSSVLSAILSLPRSPNARAISRFPAGWSDAAMKSRICLRLGRPAGRLPDRLSLGRHGERRGSPGAFSVFGAFGPCSALTALAQLAILAAAAVDGRMHDRLVALGLARDAGPHAGQRLAPLLRDRLAAIVAFLGALALRASAHGRAGPRPSPCRRSGPEPRRRASIRRPCISSTIVIADVSAGIPLQRCKEAGPARNDGYFLRRRNIGLERAARNRRGDRAFEPVLAHRRDAEHPIVDADVGQHDCTRASSRGPRAIVRRVAVS